MFLYHVLEKQTVCVNVFSMANKSTNPTTTNKAHKTKEGSSFAPFVQSAYYGIWSVIGLTVLVLLAIAVFGTNSWEENLNITAGQDAAQQATPQQPQPQQPPQPTEEQLSCVEEEVGESRFKELEQGGQPEEGEAAIIEECLTE